MWQSLKFKMLSAMVLVVISGVVITALYASRSTTGEFQKYITHGQTMRERRFDQFLTDYYDKGQSWEGVQPLVAQLAAVSGERIVLADVKGIVVADSQQTLIGNTAGLNWISKIVNIGSETVGYLYFNPLINAETSTAGYLVSVTRSVWVGALIAVVIALFATLLLSRSILHPIEDLTLAARKMQKGDMSTRVRVTARDEVGQLGDSFNSMADSLAKQEQLRKNMVSDVAHELRTPLSNIRGYLEAARDGILEPDPDLINNLYDEATLLNRLIDDLQVLAQAEAGHLRLEILPTNLGEVIQTTIDNMFLISQNLDLIISCDLPADLPIVTADPQRIGQVLRNLINNALDYTPAGGRVCIQVGIDGAFARVAVKDNGLGVEPEHLPYLFERFYRPDPSRTRFTGGSGLGLAIVKQLVEAQGGLVGVESRPGIGSTFYFTLPVFKQSDLMARQDEIVSHANQKGNHNE
jgi:signal transduction histidine kinase